MGALLAAVICSGTAFAQASGEQTDIVVNGVALSADTVRALQQVYPVAIAPGCFGYDAVSGAYGRAPMGVRYL